MPNDVFGLAFIKKEGGKLFPPDYFIFNESLPSKEMYSKEELEEHKKAGIAEYWYKNSMKGIEE
ncbi:MAG TPA: hypothetical protein VFM18_04825 [Methanosarcina sp.]|nr:hypothetical protein [Methanosarcina sp.]